MIFNDNMIAYVRRIFFDKNDQRKWLTGGWKSYGIINTNNGRGKGTVSLGETMYLQAKYSPTTDLATGAEKLVDYLATAGTVKPIKLDGINNIHVRTASLVDNSGSISNFARIGVIKTPPDELTRSIQTGEIYEIVNPGHISEGNQFPNGITTLDVSNLDGDYYLYLFLEASTYHQKKTAEWHVSKIWTS